MCENHSFVWIVDYSFKTTDIIATTEVYKQQANLSRDLRHHILQHHVNFKAIKENVVIVSVLMWEQQTIQNIKQLSDILL